jgi:hypothetical protein
LKRALLALLLVACADRHAGVQAVRLPGKAVVPFVADDGVISFMDDEAKAFRFVTFRDGKFSEPRTIASDPNMLINRADFPSIWVDGDDMVATWSTTKEHGAVVHVARSTDGGATWSPPRTPHPDVVSQFGFVSLAGEDFVYLDGRKLEGGMEGNGDMELRAGDGTLLDPRVCDCCQTAMAMTSQGPIVAYRDRSADEVRDISIVRRTADGWTPPKTLHADNWKIMGCPVNGPQIDADGNRVAVAWFTAANDQPRVYIAFSEDSGETFGAPILVPSRDAAGRVDVVLSDDRAAVLTWVAQTGGKASLYVRRVYPDGTIGSEERALGEASGFPRAARWGENVAIVRSRPDGAFLELIEGF